MKTVGIIAEYNPFHNGHFYQLKEAKKVAGADYCVVVMSGNFTQRGTPALVDKYARCEMALCAGADLVIELPVCFATASAEFFARGAVAILDHLRVNAICFGSECGEIAPLKSVAEVLLTESAAFKKQLKQKLKEGMSYPSARSLAITQCMAKEQPERFTLDEALLNSPNNILGIEYLKALYSLKSTMETYTLERKGSGYLDFALPDASFCSALAIRKHLSEKLELTKLQGYIPQSSMEILDREMQNGYPLFTDDFSSILYYRLLSLKGEGYDSFFDVSPSMSNKISKHLDSYGSYINFCNELLKSKDLTQTRISRCLLHILLNIKKQDLTTYDACGDVLYARILGFRKDSQALFQVLKKGKFPLISKLADADQILSQTGLKMLNQDIFAAHLYDGVAAQKTGRPIENEYRRQIVIL
ncbi:MAG TPA: nucleotidyltransferase [Lachnospiraceae bacterium]|nr:nucleotidyltransferase [Lachnospiraceae bacterium]